MQNSSPLDYTEVSIADQHFGDVAASATGDYRSVKSICRDAALELTANGKRVTGQTLNTGAERFTCQIDIDDLAKGRLAIEIVRDS